MSIHHHHHLLLLKLPSQKHHFISQTTLNSHPLCHYNLTHIPKSKFFLVPPCRSSRWDPNAEFFNNKNFNFDSKNNGSDKSRYLYEEYGEEDEDELKGLQVWGAVLDEYVDSIWILKVFGSYGLFLPFILLSILLSSGLKAFPIALALPLAQSTISFFLQKIWGSTNFKSRRKVKSKGKSRVRGSSTFTAKRDRKEKRPYPSFVPGQEVSADNWGNDGDSSFGGWDELDWGRDVTRSSPKSDQRATRPEGIPSKKDNFTRLERRSDTPLLLRLLVAVFPFMGWWMKMF